MQNYFRALCLAQSPEVIYAQGWSSEGCARLPGTASSSWLCSWCEGFLTLEGRSGTPQSRCLFLLKDSSCPHSSCVQLLWMEALQRLIKCLLIKSAGLLSRDIPSLPALVLLPTTAWLCWGWGLLCPRAIPRAAEGIPGSRAGPLPHWSLDKEPFGPWAVRRGPSLCPTMAVSCSWGLWPPSMSSPLPCPRNPRVGHCIDFAAHGFSLDLGTLKAI